MSRPRLAVPALLAMPVAFYLAVWYYRTDYAAHVLAGIAIALALYGAAPTRARSAAVLVAPLIVVVLGVVGELTLFGPDFDLVDVANGAIGAALVAGVLADRPAVSRRVCLIVGTLLFGLSLWLRYKAQYYVSQLWYE